MSKCKVCGNHLGGAYRAISLEGDELYVAIVDNNLYLMKTDNALCSNCEKKAVWYKRMDRDG